MAKVLTEPEVKSELLDLLDLVARETESSTSDKEVLRQNILWLHERLEILYDSF
jgi:hypothetical protein